MESHVSQKTRDMGHPRCGAGEKQAPFGFAQGRLSTSQDHPLRGQSFSARNDKIFWKSWPSRVG
jgi:hypothetical protein